MESNFKPGIVAMQMCYELLLWLCVIIIIMIMRYYYIKILDD